METEIAKPETGLPAVTFTRDQIELIKKTVAVGASDDELALFLYTAKKSGLDPLLRQIHFVKRNGKDGAKVSFQTGIDGYRLTAERTGLYAPGREPSFNIEDGKLISATAYVKKKVAGEWHEVAATAFYDEYCPKSGNDFMWQKMPKAMLSKCAESLALRRAFPVEMAWVHTDEEMEQANEPAPESVPMPKRKSESPIETHAVRESAPPAKEPMPQSGDPDIIPMEIIPEFAEAKNREKDGKTYVQFLVKDKAGNFYSTLNEADGEKLLQAHEAKVKVKFFYKQKGAYRNITKVFEPGK